jgi:hypothetical protein
VSHPGWNPARRLLSESAFCRTAITITKELTTNLYPKGRLKISSAPWQFDGYKAGVLPDYPVFGTKLPFMLALITVIG